MKYLLPLLLFSTIVSAQEFQSTSNPYYWKNKIANDKSYWQQDIDYTIDASLDEKKEIISGTETIVYTNNSPYSLHELYFNLYQNAFIKNSYLSHLQEANGDKVKYGKWEKEGKGNEILTITVDGENVRTEVDGTIMKVWLNKPMISQSSIKIDIAFKTYYAKGGNTRRRMKSYDHQGRKHFNGAQWYPRLAVYDRKFGWCTDQHLNREFYGDFGTYSVSFDMPADFIMEATGVLQNEKEVLPDTLRQQLDLSNFWNNPWDTAVIYKMKIKDSARKTWKYLGENVHDFAWIAGPHYRIHEKMNNGIKSVAMVLEPHASGWKNAADLTQQTIALYSRDFGQYAYPKMVVADCQDGMEYPMLTMDGGRDPSYRKLLVHEIGHNWFYGMVNNNETYRAMLDEGFTQFLTVWALEHLDGKYLFDGRTDYMKKGEEGKISEARDANSYTGYLLSAMQNEAPPINIHSDGFHGAVGHGGGYGHVYYKTSTMLYNLQYVLGDSLFLNAMKYYFDQWSFRHPYIEDFRKSIIEYTQVDLNWFFDQWIETPKNIDYKIFPLKKVDKNTYTLTLKRKEEMQMPLDIAVTGQSGKVYNFYIPNTWYEKKSDAITLPRWIGWDAKLKPLYQTNITLPEEPKFAEIDPSKRLADINEMDNTTASAIQFQYIDNKEKPFDRHHYTMFWKPLVWYNNFDGVKLGLHFEGSHMKYFKNLSVDIWGNTTLGKSVVRPQEDLSSALQHSYTNDIMSFRVKYHNQLKALGNDANVSVQLQHLDGVAYGKLEINKKISNKIWMTLGDKFLWKRTLDQMNYDYRPSYTWNQIRAINNSLYIQGLTSGKIAERWRHTLNATLRTSLFTQLQYSYFDIENKHTISSKKIEAHIRLYGRIGINGDDIANETQLNAGGANGEELMNNEFMRSATFFPYLFTPGNEVGLSGQNYSKLHLAGGLNMRGYSFRPSVQDDNGVYSLVNQNTGMSLNTQIDFQKLSPIKFSKISKWVNMKTYLFGDIGQVGLVSKSLKWNYIESPWLYDMGAGASFTFHNLKIFDKIRPLTFRFDMPLYLSHPAMEDNNEHFKFRYLIGVEQAF